MWEDIFVKSRKYTGFLAKARDLAGLTGIDPGQLGSNLLDLDPTAADGGWVKQWRRIDQGR
jgi:hypothetical protein